MSLVIFTFYYCIFTHQNTCKHDCVNECNITKVISEAHNVDHIWGGGISCIYPPNIYAEVFYMMFGLFFL